MFYTAWQLFMNKGCSPYLKVYTSILPQGLFIGGEELERSDHCIQLPNSAWGSSSYISCSEHNTPEFATTIGSSVALWIM